MARKPRIHYTGALYHVIVRGNNGEDVLREELHKSKYLDIIALYKDKIGFTLYAYCIMDNHAHLLIEVNDIPLSKIMQRIQQVYTQWFNQKYNRTGHVFQQRYKALLCDKDNYLLQLIRYIHNNPARANLEGGIAYKWSSHEYYTGKKYSDIVNTSFVLGLFSENKDKAVRQYLQFMNQEDQEDKEITYVNIDRSQPAGIIQSPDIAGIIQSSDIIEKKEDFTNNISIDDLIKEVCRNEKVTIGDITKKTKIQKISDIRKAIVLLSEDYYNVSNKLISQLLCLSPTMISKIRSGKSKGTDYVEEVIKRWEENK